MPLRTQPSSSICLHTHLSSAALPVVVQVAGSQVDAPLVRFLSAAAPQLKKLHLRRCHLLPGACAQLALLSGLTQLALTWTSFK